MAGIAEQLRQAVLQAAIQGKLTEQLPEDGDAKDLLAEIQAEKDKLIAEKIIKKERPLEPISDGEIPFDIPENWKWTRLNDIVSALGDGIHGTPQFSDEGECYFVNGNNLSNGKVVIKPDTKRISWQEFEKYKKELNQNTIFVSINGTIGNYAFYDNEPIILGKSACYFNVLSKTDKKYLCNLIKTKFFLSYTTKEATKTTIKNVSLKAMRMLPIPLPPLAEQHRIVARVDELMAKIDELEKVENELNALHKAFPGDMKAALLQAAMQGKLTEQLPEDRNAEDLLKSIETEKAKLIAEKKIKKQKPLKPISDDEIPFEIPDNWKFVRLGEAYTVIMGQAPQGDMVLPYSDGSMEFHQGKIFFTDEIIGKSNVCCNTASKIAPEHSVLLCVRAPIGIVNITDRTIGIGRGLAAIAPIASSNIKFLFYLMRSQKNSFVKQGTGSTFKAITADVVFNQIVPLPPLAEQQRIVEKLDKLLPLCDSLEEKL